VLSTTGSLPAIIRTTSIGAEAAGQGKAPPAAAGLHAVRLERAEGEHGTGSFSIGLKRLEARLELALRLSVLLGDN